MQRREFPATVCGTVMSLPRGRFLVVSSEVDVTLVQETLALTPQQRIQQNDRVLRMIEELRDGVAKSRKPARDTGDERR
jgi:hypothetical protein